MEGVDIPQVLHELKTLRRWDYTENAHWEWQNVAGVKTKVYTKYFTGIMDADAETVVAHGLADIDKILLAKGMIYDDVISIYRVSEHYAAEAATIRYSVSIDSTNISLSAVGTNLEGTADNVYRIKMEYYL